MATKHPDSAPRLGGVLISNQVVAELLEQLRNGIWRIPTICRPNWSWPTG